ncbi:FAD-binding protein [Anaerobacillus sp. HL2]|nr:FAD-binding protein [Anaerobacillus sp. HL2]
MSKDDDWQNHFQDTIVAGGNHNVKAATKLLVKNGSLKINKLIELGVNFDKNEHNCFALGMEGALSIRILHAGGDSTGKAIVDAVMKKVFSKINIVEKAMAFDLFVDEGVCKGVYTKDEKGNLCLVEADHIIIQIGIGQLYSVTSNCEEATGDGIAMANRAGAAIGDMEFIQFHPTLMMDGEKSLGLISEAVHVEKVQSLQKKTEIANEIKHPMEDLAPRDIVAREIYKVKQENEETIFRYN